MGRFKEIRGREEKATPGPWFNFSNYLVHTEPDVAACGIDPKQCIGTVRGKDADFIAHAREDIPFLLGEVERLNDMVVLMQNHESATGKAYNLALAQIGGLLEKISRLTVERDTAVSDRDRWKARAESLERKVDVPHGEMG